MDQDGDGKVTKEEASGLPDMVFDRMDSDGDGAVSQEEIEAMRSRFGDGGGPGRGP